jgi:hypothetical protein
MVTQRFEWHMRHNVTIVHNLNVVGNILAREVCIINVAPEGVRINGTVEYHM